MFIYYDLPKYKQNGIRVSQKSFGNIKMYSIELYFTIFQIH